MKKILIFITAILIGLTSFAQQMGGEAVPPGYGSITASQHHQRVLDSAGTYLPNVAPHRFDVLRSYGIDPVFYLDAASQSSGTVMAHIPTDGTGDGTMARNSTSYNQNYNGYLEPIAVNTLAVDYSNGIPYFATYPQRTNIITYPISLDNVVWSLSGATLDDNGGAGYSFPHLDYLTAGFKLENDGSTGVHRIFRGGILISASTTYTSSFYLKKAENTWAELRIFVNGQSLTAKVWFDLDNGVVGTESNATGNIQYLSDGWYRCSLTVDVDGTATDVTDYVYLADADNSDSYTGTLGDGIYIAMAQLEEGDYASPLMLPTTEGSTTTRLADAVTAFGSSAVFSDVNENGAIIVKMAAHSNSMTLRNVSLSDGTNANRILLQYNATSNTIAYFLISGSTTQASGTYAVSDVTDFHYIGLYWDTDDISFVVDGVERGTDVSATTFSANTLDEFKFTNAVGTDAMYGKTQYVIIGDISKANLLTLTTP